MGIQVNIGQAKDRFSELVAAAERGEEVVITRALSADAGDLFLEPTFTDEEMERFGLLPGESLPE